MRAAWNDVCTIYKGPLGNPTDPIIAVNVPCRFVPQTLITGTDTPLSWAIAWITTPMLAPGGRVASGLGNLLYLDYSLASTIVLDSDPTVRYYTIFSEESTSWHQPPYYRALVAPFPLVEG